MVYLMLSCCVLYYNNDSLVLFGSNLITHSNTFIDTEIKYQIYMFSIWSNSRHGYMAVWVENEADNCFRKMDCLWFHKSRGITVIFTFRHMSTHVKFVICANDNSNTYVRGNIIWAIWVESCWHSDMLYYNEIMASAQIYIYQWAMTYPIS